MFLCRFLRATGGSVMCEKILSMTTDQPPITSVAFAIKLTDLEVTQATWEYTDRASELA